MQSETLAQEFARLVKEYHEGDDQTKPEAWNLLADYAVDNADAISAALSEKQTVEVNIKPLEWEGELGTEYAVSILGLYSVWEGHYRLPGAHAGIRADDPKQAAQKHLERIIRSALVDVPAGVRWRVFEDTTHGWWGIEIDGDEDGEPILYPIKTDRASLDKIADAYNATASTSKLIEERDTARRQAEDQWAGWVKSDCRVRALEAAVRLAIKGIEGADPEVLTDTLWMPEAILKGATVVDVLQGALSECLQARRTSPPLSREGEDSAEVVTLTRAEADRIAQRLEFDASWDKCGDGYYSIKRQLGTLAATRSGSATSASGTSAIRQRGESE